ncbi:ureidoglycolate lyase [Natronocella acetinitrilica]|uniref:Ureidoglycolate lyase n=1 Tax=Natronocella acetinitrilica TaxID=414046 RepID=A0AAE3G1M6_9GAMM|nr:ureidoglycolate lyase [Natronocella acetinitrilica]MCP1674026.1 ureidoglycolate lyase [Natronocella acetinitrilica]
MRTLTAKPLTRDAFEPFGDVIETTSAPERFPINNGSTMRYHALAGVELKGDDARGIVSIFRGQPFAFPVTLQLMERHPLGSQCFVPMRGERFLLVVAPPVDVFGVDDLRAFITNGSQGVNYRAGVWHHPLLSLDRVSDFLVVDRAGSGNNCDERELPEKVRVVM